MNLRNGFLALFVVVALTSQASAQFFTFGRGFGGFGGLGGFGFPFGGGFGGYGGYPYGGMGGYGGYPYGGYGGYGGYGFGVPSVWQNSRIVAYTTATTVTQPVIPPNSPLSLDPNFNSWADQHGYYLRPGETPPRYRNSLYPATPVDPSELVNGNLAHIQVIVPSNGAQVSVDGKQMTQTGTVRNFITPPLEPGKDYTLNFQVQDGGQTINQSANVRAGEQKVVDFTKDR